MNFACFLGCRIDGLQLPSHFDVTTPFSSAVLSLDLFSQVHKFSSGAHGLLPYFVANYLRGYFISLLTSKASPLLDICCWPPTDLCACGAPYLSRNIKNASKFLSTLPFVRSVQLSLNDPDFVPCLFLLNMLRFTVPSLCYLFKTDFLCTHGPLHLERLVLLHFIFVLSLTLIDRRRSVRLH